MGRGQNWAGGVDHAQETKSYPTPNLGSEPNVHLLGFLLMDAAPSRPIGVAGAPHGDALLHRGDLWPLTWPHSHFGTTVFHGAIGLGPKL